MSDQTEIPCVLMRAGTSKGPFFHRDHLPPHGPERDRVLLAVMGSPDLLQIDGLGGSRPITSKIAIISRSDRPDADVDYLFAQVATDKPLVGYNGNCGNISSGVGPFAIDEGLVEAIEPVTTVRIFNVNTGKILIAHVPVKGGKARVDGDFAIPGVPGTGAEILLDYTGTTGAKTGRLLPTGNPVDSLILEDGRAISYTFCDIGNPTVWVSAADLDMQGSELAEIIDNDEPLLARVLEIRGKAAQRVGMCDDWRQVEAQSPGLPLLGFVSPPEDYVTSNGNSVAAGSIDFRARLLFMGRMHESMAGTASMSLAAASRIAGSVVNKVARRASDDIVRIGHPLGSMDVKVEVEPHGGDEVQFRRVGMSRTARRIMAGTVCLPTHILETSLTG